MDKSSNIDVNKLTKEAEAGHGHYVRSVMDKIPFEEQIRIANEMDRLSKKHSNDYSLPQVEFVMYQNTFEPNQFKYDAIRLYRITPDTHLGPLFGGSELVYENSVNLTTGDKTVTEMMKDN